MEKFKATENPDCLQMNPEVESKWKQAKEMNKSL